MLMPVQRHERTKQEPSLRQRDGRMVYRGWPLLTSVQGCRGREVHEVHCLTSATWVLGAWNIILVSSWRVLHVARDFW
jgi:hypothetical protein